MSSTGHAGEAGAGTRVPRVREQARAVVALMTFSALASGTLAVALVLLASLGR